MTIYTSSPVAITHIHGYFEDLDPHRVSLTTLGDIYRDDISVQQAGVVREYRTNIDLHARPPISGVLKSQRCFTVDCCSLFMGATLTVCIGGHYLAAVFVGQNLEWNLQRKKLLYVGPTPTFEL